MTNHQLKLRRAIPQDSLDVAKVHVASWQTAYRGIVPDPYLDTLSIEERAARYTFELHGQQNPNTWIATVSNSAIGFVTFSRSRDLDLASMGETQALYIAPATWRRGIGTMLLDLAEKEMAGWGLKSAALWVFASNHRARSFYESRGWTADGTLNYLEIQGRSLPEVRYQKTIA